MKYSKYFNEKKNQSDLISYTNFKAFFSNYTDIEGILTFRGNHYRDSSAYGKTFMKEKKLLKKWVKTTSHLPHWGGGAGWTT